MAAIRATFSDFKLVRSRKVAQLVMEVPLEEADAALTALGGIPQAQTERWVGIAPITEQAAQRAPVKAAKRPWGELSMSQQSGVLCADPEFQQWIGARSVDEAAAIVREKCDVASRRDIGLTEVSAREWQIIVSDYRARR